MAFRITAIVFATVLFTAPAGAQRSYDTDILAETFGFDADTKKSVSLDDLHQGCPARDCIPSIDEPKFVAAADADHIDVDAVVIAIELDGDARAYPARILDHHEIVNDTIAGQPIAITWCPLCGSAVGVRREVGDEITEFGVSGVLYNSDLVFYDRRTETLWDQIEAKGIVGPETGTKLDLVPVTMTTWGRWQKAHPDSRVLSTDTGFEKDYSQDRYDKYRDSVSLMFPVGKRDDRVHPKSVVFGFEFDGRSLAYTEKLLQQQGTYTHELDGKAVAVTLADDGRVELTTGGETYAPIRLFWFAWYTFHPDTELFE
ncbi:MAG: DUF3179 domain-containing protein [Woeseiaceae bacterium]|nr:DUF3179 domain-containing protein [Woeseiaceae bacterium]